MQDSVFVMNIAATGFNIMITLIILILILKRRQVYPWLILYCMLMSTKPLLPLKSYTFENSHFYSTLMLILFLPTCKIDFKSCQMIGLLIMILLHYQYTFIVFGFPHVYEIIFEICLLCIASYNFIKKDYPKAVLRSNKGI